MMHSVFAPFFALLAVTVEPPTVPATSSQTSIITLAAPAMVRIAAQSGPGTSCTVVDKVRGPFQSSGQVGKSNCAMDLLLDTGSYKLKVESPRRGKGTVAISARPFSEINAKPLRIDKGRRVEQTLRSGEQASFWLSIQERQVPFLHVLGKNAGDVRLWKNGEWLEPVSFSHATFAAGQSRAVHEWRFDEMLEPGEYLLTAYGTNPLAGSSGEASDALTVEYGFESLPPEGSLAFTLPATGTLSLRSPRGRGAFLVSLDGPPTAPFQGSAADLQSPSYLGLQRTGEQPLPEERGLVKVSQFVIEPKRLVPQTSAFVDSDEVHVLMLRGMPGTRGLIEWARTPKANTWAGGYYGAAERNLAFTIDAGGDYLVGLHDLPADTDAAPLGCHLEQQTAKGPQVVARDVLSLGPGQQLERDFNYDGKNALIWFEVGRSDRYRIETVGGRKNRCEVWRFGPNGELSRITQSKPDAQSCGESLLLNAGAYQISLYDGLSGIEKLSIRPEGQRAAKTVPAKAGCMMMTKGLLAGRYTLVASRGGNLAARGLVLQALPLALDAPVHLAIDPGRALSVPVASAPGVLARSTAGKPFECNAMSVPGQCPIGPGTLQLKNPNDEVVVVSLVRPSSPPAVPPLVAFDPKVAPVGKTALDRPAYFDFERGQSHSLLFEVDRAGLYNVTTLGLLSTECRLRTPVVPDVAHDAGSGRGRNCLVSGYLRPGRYLVTATATEKSRGRAGVLLTRRMPREYASVNSGSETFFRVEAGELVQQKLHVGKAGELRLSTTAQGVGLRCRLDDVDGWPLDLVPTACTQTRTFPAGSFLWTQLPLTVESMRHTRLEKVIPPLVLKGNKPHAIDFHTFYTAQLGSNGKDEFLFKLEGEATVEVVLTKGMQGHIYQLSPDKPPRPMEVIPAQTPPPQQLESGEESSESGDSEGERPAVREDEGERAENNEETPPASPRPSSAPVQPSAAPPLPSGTKVTLPPGQYKLVAEHSRGDVGIEYQLHLGSEVLLPGMSRELPTPVVLPVSMPRAGTLRLRTEGEADLACRLFDGERLVFESAESTGDWNCALAEPLAAGKYRLVLESRTQRAGKTRLQLALAVVEDGGPVRNGNRTLAAAVQTVSLPVAPPAADAVYEVSFRARGPFSCALEDGLGRVVHRQTRVSECAMLIRPGAEPWKVRLWTTDGTTQIEESLRVKPIAVANRGTLPGNQASLVSLSKAGRYSSSAEVYCLGGDARGLLRPCGPDSSLEAGATVFASFGIKDQSLPLAEQVLAQSAPASQSLALGQQSWLQGYSAPQNSVFLISAEVQHGERAAPACAFDTGVRETQERTCFAASSVGTTAMARAWAAVPAVGYFPPVPARLDHRVVALPAQETPLGLGYSRVKLSGEASLFSLPKAQRARLEMTLPGDAWAVLLDDKGGAIDLCVPVGRGSALSHCVLSGWGGKVLIVSGDAQADITTVQLEAPEKNLSLSRLGLYEDAPYAPGSLRLRVAAENVDRFGIVEGDARCTFIFSSGARIAGCQTWVPRGLAVEIKIEHGTGPLRAMVYVLGRERWARLGMEPPPQPGPALPAAVAIPLVGMGGARLDRTLVLAKDTVVRIRADAGVCGLLRGDDLLAVDGFDGGCELLRLLPAGTYRILLRPFADRPLPGTLRWTAEPVATLGEGVGPEDFIAPAEVRVYRFSTAAKGWLGLGMQAASEALECSISDTAHRLLGDGCQQYLKLEQGNYLLTVRLPRRSGTQPLRIKPVLLGLAGTKADVPEEYLKDLFRRIGVTP
ncbi:MAG TPA: hypothetical protein PKI03_18410 [Pseudomonadota bacterium]|nr:hypothetical protein [Pseudomonadota bacterium]